MRMRKSGADTRRRIVEQAYSLFYKKGFTRVSMDDIAARAGVTKRTVYAHFSSKDGLFTAALEQQDELVQTLIREWSARISGSAEALLDTLFADFARWATQPRSGGSGITRLAMELADLPGHPAHAVARRHKLIMEGWYAGELAKRNIDRPKERARELMLLMEGANALMVIHRDGAYAKAAAQAGKRLLRKK